MQQILIIVAIVLLVLLVRAWFRRPAGDRLKWLIYLALGGVAVLALTGRLHWLAAVGTALIGLMAIVAKKLFLLVRFLPMIGGFINRAGYGKVGNGRFETAWLRLEVNPLTGSIDGEVLQGEFKQKRLSSMSVSELESLCNTLQGQDRKSALLLRSYLAIRTRTGSSGEAGPDKSTMTREEALNTLGLKEGATHEEIIRAYKRLMQKIHPDRGGSAYLAAKINQAKELLEKK